MTNYFKDLRLTAGSKEESAPIAGPSRATTSRPDIKELKESFCNFALQNPDVVTHFKEVFQWPEEGEFSLLNFHNETFLRALFDWIVENLDIDVLEKLCNDFELKELPWEINEFLKKNHEDLARKFLDFCNPFVAVELCVSKLRPQRDFFCRFIEEQPSLDSNIEALLPIPANANRANPDFNTENFSRVQFDWVLDNMDRYALANVVNGFDMSTVAHQLVKNCDPNMISFFATFALEFPEEAKQMILTPQ